MSVSDLYRRLQESNDSRESKRNAVGMTKNVTDKPAFTIKPGSTPSQPNPGPSDVEQPESGTGSEQETDKPNAQSAEDAIDNPRLQQMLKVLRESEARHKRKIQRDATIGIGDIVTVLSGPYAEANARVCDLDYINLVAMVERVGSGQRLWLNLSNLALAE